MIKYPNGGVPHQHVERSVNDDGKEIFWPLNVGLSKPHDLLQRKDVLARVMVRGEPVPAGRPRFTRQGHAFDPKRSRQYKTMVHEVASMQYHGELIAGKAIAVKISIYRSIQKSVSHKEHDRRATGEHRPIVKPDTSNYVKLIEDALTGVIWEDDNLIVSLVADKYYSDDPRIEVTVTEIGG